MPSSSPSPAEIVAALQRGGVAEALKLVLAAKRRASTGERRPAAAQATRPAKPVAPSSKAAGLSPGEVPRSNGDIWLLLVAGAMLLGAHYLFGS